jgi:hypothetical protein
VAQPRGHARQSFTSSGAATIVALLGLLAGCGDHGAGPDVDAGDAGQEPDGDTRACAGPTICDGTAVRTCGPRGPGEIIEECGPDRTCSLGRCSTISCAQAERDVTSLAGCTFYTFHLANVASDDMLPTSVLVTNPGQVSATVTLERREGPDWVATTSVPVPPMRSARLRLPTPPRPAADTTPPPDTAFRVTSDFPLLAAHVQSDDSAPGGSTSTGGTMLLPAHVLGLRYRAMTFVQTVTPRLVGTQGSRGGAGHIAIVGTRAHTSVTVTAGGKGGFAPEGGAPAVTPPKGSFALMLDDGDVQQLFGANDGDDLTGTQILADKPIAVFSGNVSTTYGLDAVGISSPDLAHEQLLPVASWGQSYIAAALTPQAGVCDPLLDPPGSSLWRILADRDDTMVTFSQPMRPGEPRPPPRLLNAGESFQVSVQGNFTVTSTPQSHPVMVMQGMDCEPSLSSAVPAGPWLTNYRFAVLPNFDTMLVIVRRKGTPIYYDEARLEESLFERVTPDLEAAQVPVEACSPSDDVCTHHLEGQFGLTMRGMDVQCSYAMTAPTWVPCTEPGVPGCLN